MDKHNLLLYAVTDRSWLCGETLYDQAEKALKGGATMLQLREKNLCKADFLSEAEKLKALCHRYGVPFLVNDDVEIAAAVGADGVTGPSEMEAGRVRALLGRTDNRGIGPDCGGSAPCQSGAPTIWGGRVSRPTEEGRQRRHYDSLQSICRAVSIPVVAIGGITKENVSRLAGSGIDGVAVVSAIFAAPDIERAAAELKSAVQEMLQK